MSIATTNRTIASSNNHQTQQPPMILDSKSMQWSAQGRYPTNGLTTASSAFCIPTAFASNPSCIGYSQQAQNSMSYNANYNLTYPTQYNSLGCPRMYNGVDLSGLPSDIGASYPPATFFHTPPQNQDTLSLPDSEHPELVRTNNEYDIQCFSRIKQKDQLNHNSPYANTSRASTPYSNLHEDGNAIDKEQPYAQLIYRALLDAPNHTMVLRDIYDWFLRYTDKAAHSETKGWQNSIRHNLSMNGVRLFVFQLMFSLSLLSLPPHCRLEENTNNLRLSKKSTLPRTLHPKASCGVLLPLPSEKASRAQHVTARKCPTSAPPPAHSRFPSARLPAQREVMLLDVQPICGARNACENLVLEVILILEIGRARVCIALSYPSLRALVALTVNMALAAKCLSILIAPNLPPLPFSPCRV